MQRDKQESQARFNRRALLMGVAGVAVFAGLGARLYSLQILEQERYRTLSDDNQFNYRLQPPARGRLLDRFDQALAENRDSYRLMIVPEQAGDPRAALDRLARFMPLSEERIERLVREIRRSPRFQPVTIGRISTGRPSPGSTCTCPSCRASPPMWAKCAPIPIPRPSPM